MQILRIKGFTRELGKSQGYLGLPVKDIVRNDSVTGPDTPAMQTAWEPLPDELERINAGAPIIVEIIGINHPPIMLKVGEIPK